MLATDLQLHRNDASDLCAVLDAERLGRRGWDRALLTIFGEAPAEESLAVLVHDAPAEPERGWHAVGLPATATRAAGRTTDATACSARAGEAWVLGSQFGRQDGPLDPRRSWVARLTEEDLERALDGVPAALEIVRLRFGLHRAINDSLRAAAVDLIALGDRARQAYIDATIRLGAAQQKRWSGRVTSADHPVDVAGAAFRHDGRLLLGLRHPTTAEGHPLLVEVDDPEQLFRAPDEVPSAGTVWVLRDVGSADAPCGVRALAAEGVDHFHAVVGDLDGSRRSATILEDHPEGAMAGARHVRFSLPLTARGGDVATQQLHEFGEVRRVEGVALGPGGHAHHVVGEEGAVTLLIDDQS